MALHCVISQQYREFSLELDLELPTSGVTAIFGRSGSGKTSLLRAIAGLNKATGNAVKLNNEVWQSDSHFTPIHQRRLAYVFQEPSLFPHLSVLGNLDYAFKRVSKVEERLSPIKAAEMLSIGHLLHRDVMNLSGGERQRVAIARAICSSPQIMLMDEPLVALDRHSQRQILSVLESLSRDLALPIFYVSHSLEEVARLADHLVLMDNGRIIANGDIQTLLTSLQYPLARDVDAEAVIAASIVECDDEFDMSYLESDIGRISVLNSSLKSNLNLGDEVRVLIAARDVSLTLERQQDTSILNIFCGQVDDILCGEGSQVTVRIVINKVPVLARITKKSLAAMALTKGDTVYVQAKSVALL